MIQIGQPVSRTILVTFIKNFFKVYLFLREKRERVGRERERERDRDRENALAGEGQRERERENPKQALHYHHKA